MADEPKASKGKKKSTAYESLISALADEVGKNMGVATAEKGENSASPMMGVREDNVDMFTSEALQMADAVVQTQQETTQDIAHKQAGQELENMGKMIQTGMSPDLPEVKAQQYDSLTGAPLPSMAEFFGPLGAKLPTDTAVQRGDITLEEALMSPRGASELAQYTGQLTTALDKASEKERSIAKWGDTAGIIMGSIGLMTGNLGLFAAGGMLSGRSKRALEVARERNQKIIDEAIERILKKDVDRYGTARNLNERIKADIFDRFAQGGTYEEYKTFVESSNLPREEKDNILRQEIFDSLKAGKSPQDILTEQGTERTADVESAKERIQLSGKTFVSSVKQGDPQGVRDALVAEMQSLGTVDELQAHNLKTAGVAGKGEKGEALPGINEVAIKSESQGTGVKYTGDEPNPVNAVTGYAEWLAGQAGISLIEPSKFGRTISDNAINLQVSSESEKAVYPILDSITTKGSIPLQANELAMLWTANDGKYSRVVKNDQGQAILQISTGKLLSEGGVKPGIGGFLIYDTKKIGHEYLDTVVLNDRGDTGVSTGEIRAAWDKAWQTDGFIDPGKQKMIDLVNFLSQ